MKWTFQTFLFSGKGMTEPFYSPIRLCLKGFLLDPKVMGGSVREAATLGPLGMRPPWVPWASRLGSSGLQSLVPRPKSQNPKNCFGAFDCQKIAFGVLSCQRIASGVPNCQKCFGILSCHKLPGHSKLSKNAMQWMQSKAMQIKTKQCKAKQCKYKAKQRSARQK